MLPKISIVIPTYNDARFIERCILSITSQEYSNLELIIIDGGSTDDTVEIIKKFDKFIFYWVSEKDRGQSHAINKGFKICTGEIITFFSSDDIYVFRVDKQSGLLDYTGYSAQVPTPVCLKMISIDD